MSALDRTNLFNFFSPLPTPVFPEAEMKVGNVVPLFNLLNRNINNKIPTYAKVVYTLFLMSRHFLEEYERTHAVELAKPLVRLALAWQKNMAWRAKIVSFNAKYEQDKKEAEAEIARNFSINIQVSDLKQRLESLKTRVSQTHKIGDELRKEFEDLRKALNSLKESRKNRKAELEILRTRLEEVQQKRNR